MANSIGVGPHCKQDFGWKSAIDVDFDKKAKESNFPLSLLHEGKPYVVEVNYVKGLFKIQL